jgi:type I restriction enzyme S subunit
MVVRPKNTSIEMRFLEYLFRGGIDISKAITGAAQPQITRTNLAPLEITYPLAVEEQKRIVDILDEAFDGIATAKANAEKNLQNAHALFESHLQSVFTQRGEGWVEKKLGDVCSIARGGSPRPIQKFITTDPDGINWIKIGDATASRKYIYKTEENIIPDGARHSRMVRDGDFLLSNSMSFGRPYIMRTFGCIHDGWLVLSDYASHLDQDYLYYVLGSSFVYHQFDRLASGSTVRNLNIELASRVEIPIPPLPHQQEIAQRFDAFATETRRLESIYQQKLNALEALKKSLLHQAFTGQL